MNLEGGHTMQSLIAHSHIYLPKIPLLLNMMYCSFIEDFSRLILFTSIHTILSK